MDAISPHRHGSVVVVWVVPGASRSEVSGRHGDAIKVRVAAPPEGGKATRAAAEVLGAALGGAAVTLLAGTTSRRKRFLIAGLTPQEVGVRLGL